MGASQLLQESFIKRIYSLLINVVFVAFLLFKFGGVEFFFIFSGELAEDWKTKIAGYFEGGGVGGGWGGGGGGRVKVGAEGSAPGGFGGSGGVKVPGSEGDVEEVGKLVDGLLHVGASVGVRPGRTTPAEHRQLLHAGVRFLLRCRGIRSDLVHAVKKVATRSVGAEAGAVVGAANLGLVLGMSVDGSEFFMSVGELTFVSVFACSMLLEGAAHLRLVSCSWLLLVLCWRLYT
jgi:hypothetical protein